ncbi:MAG: HAD family hydrolase, partial [Acidobacteriota bacterium]
NVDYLLKKFGLEFDCVISRESGLWKPEGAPFFKAMKNLGVTAGECVVVGDSLFDIQAAREADVRHIFIISCKPEFSEISGIYVCSSVKELTSKTQDLLK